MTVITCDNDKSFVIANERRFYVFYDYDYYNTSMKPLIFQLLI